MANELKPPAYTLRRIRGWTYIYQGEQRVTLKGTAWDTAKAACDKLNEYMKSKAAQS
jgi:hypothetical protein